MRVCICAKNRSPFVLVSIYSACVRYLIHLAPIGVYNVEPTMSACCSRVHSADSLSVNTINNKKKTDHVSDCPITSLEIVFMKLTVRHHKYYSTGICTAKIHISLKKLFYASCYWQRTCKAPLNTKSQIFANYTLNITRSFNFVKIYTIYTIFASELKR